MLDRAAHKALQASQDVHKIDITIRNTITTDQRIELFNYLFSNTKVYNAACNPNFHPIAPSATPYVFGNENVGDGHFHAYLPGVITAFTDAGSPFAPANSNGAVFFKEDGALCYKPGYVNTVLDSGELTVQSSQTNYRHIFETMGQGAIYVRTIKVTVKPSYSAQLSEDFKFVSQNIASTSGSNNQGASTYQTEFATRTDLVTMPVNQMINSNSGLWYNVKGYDGANLNEVQLTVFFVPMSKGML